MKVLVALALGWLVSCTHHHRIDTLPGDLLGKRATIRTASGKTVDAWAAPTPTGLVWHAEDGTKVDGRDVVRVRTLSRGRGMLEGIGVGLTVAAGAALLGLASGDDPPCTGSSWICFRFTATDKAAMFGIGIGLPATLIGGVVGAIAGSHDDYAIDSEPRLTVAPMPHGGAVRLSASF